MARHVGLLVGCDVDAPCLVRAVHPGLRWGQERRGRGDVAPPQEVPGGHAASGQEQGNRQNNREHREAPPPPRLGRWCVHRCAIRWCGELALTLALCLPRQHADPYPGRHRGLLIHGLGGRLHRRSRVVPGGRWQGDGLRHLRRVLQERALLGLGDRPISVPLRRGPLGRGPLRYRPGRRRLDAAIALGCLPVAGAGGGRLLRLGPHRHRRRHRGDLAGGLRLFRLRGRRDPGGLARVPPGLARQHLLDNDVVGPLQHRADPGRDRRVGRQDRVQVGTGGGDPLKVLRRGEPAECRRRVVVRGRR